MHKVLQKNKGEVMKLILVLAAVFFTGTALAAKIEIKSNSAGKLTFEAVGRPAMIKIKGESAAPLALLSLENEKASLEANLDLEILKTGIDLRDEHMKEKYLEVKKFPKAKLTISSLPIPAGWEKAPTNISGQKFNGTLSLHGKEIPVEGTFSLNDKKLADAEFKIKLTDFAIEIPSYLGITVADLVTIKTQIQFE